jgi:hypothetical protein
MKNNDEKQIDAVTEKVVEDNTRVTDGGWLGWVTLILLCVLIAGFYLARDHVISMAQSGSGSAISTK